MCNCLPSRLTRQHEPQQCSVTPQQQPHRLIWSVLISLNTHAVPGYRLLSIWETHLVQLSHDPLLLGRHDDPPRSDVENWWVCKSITELHIETTNCSTWYPHLFVRIQGLLLTLSPSCMLLNGQWQRHPWGISTTNCLCQTSAQKLAGPRCWGHFTARCDIPGKILSSVQWEIHWLPSTVTE